MKRGFRTAAPPSSKELRNFGLLMAVVGAAVTVALWYKGHVGAPLWGPGIAAGGFLASALLWRAPLRPFYNVWMLLAAVLGYVNSHILLAVIFYTIFTIMGLSMRVLRRDALRLRAFGRRRSDPQRAEQSLWLRRESPLLPADHYKHQF